MELKAATVILLTIAFAIAGDRTAGAPRLPSPEPKPIFELSFDESVAPQGTLKVDEVKRIAWAAFGPGMKGKALAAESGIVEYHLSEPLVMKRGSVAFWFRPDRWDGDSFVDFMRCYAVDDQRRHRERTRIYVYPHHWTGLAVLRYPPSGKKILFCHRVYVDHWRENPDAWRQLVFTWGDGQGVLYIDGVEVAVDPKLTEALDFGALIRVGGGTYNYKNSGRDRFPTHGRTSIDEMRIYDEVLSPQQVLNEYEQVMGPLTDQDEF